MKNWLKILIAFVLTGAQGALTFSSSIYTEWGQVFAYIVLALGGVSSIVIKWPAKE